MDIALRFAQFGHKTQKCLHFINNKPTESVPARGLADIARPNG
jgi:hypothetical protein